MHALHVGYIYAYVLRNILQLCGYQLQASYKLRRIPHFPPHFIPCSATPFRILMCLILFISLNTAYFGCKPAINLAFSYTDAPIIRRSNNDELILSAPNN